MKGFMAIALAGMVSLVGWADSTVTTDYTQDTDLTINVTSGGGTVTYTGKITLTNGAKLRKTGWGIVRLTNAGNSFDGGIEIVEGGVQVDNQGALGGDDHTIWIAAGYASSSVGNRGQLILNGDGIRLKNPIVRTWSISVAHGTNSPRRFSFRLMSSRSALMLALAFHS